MKAQEKSLADTSLKTLPVALLTPCGSVQRFYP